MISDQDRALGWLRTLISSGLGSFSENGVQVIDVSWTVLKDIKVIITVENREGGFIPTETKYEVTLTKVN